MSNASPQSTRGPLAARAGTEGFCGTGVTGSGVTSAREGRALPSEVESHCSSSSTFWCAAFHSARISSASRPGVKACPGAYGRAARRLHTPCSIYLLPTGNAATQLVLRTHPVGSVVFSPSMIAGLWVNDEPLAHARLGSDYQQASRVR